MRRRAGLLRLWNRRTLLFLLALLAISACPGNGAKKDSDYYEILGLSKGCSERDITRAYRKQALKWHPDKNRDDPKVAEERFKGLSEAYEVLNDAEKRKMYDMYGKEGVSASAGGGGGPGGGGGQGWAQGFPGRGGVPNFGGAQGGPGGASFFSFGGGNGGAGGGGANGASFGGFTDPREIFEGLFGSGGGGMGGGSGDGASGLFGNMFGSPSFDDLPSMHGMGGGAGGVGGRGRGRRSRGSRAPHGPPVVKDFWCSLKELYEGCEKKLKVTDVVNDPRTGQSRRVSHVYRIVVKPGWKEGTRVTFPPTSEGLRSMCFVLRQKKHRFLGREGDCLVYECRLTEDQARRGVKVRVPLLSQSDPPIELTTKGQEVYNGKEMLLPGLGMPGRGAAGGRRGSFKIKFRVEQRSGKAFAA